MVAQKPIPSQQWRDKENNNKSSKPMMPLWRAFDSQQRFEKYERNEFHCGIKLLKGLLSSLEDLGISPVTDLTYWASMLLFYLSFDREKKYVNSLIKNK